MEFVKPQVYHIAQTRCLPALEQYVKDVGAANWTTDAPSDSEKLVEVAGRICYRSFEAGLNANVTKVREGSQPYLKNVLKSGHGSVLEHGCDSYVFHNVSRVFTHELVRHRSGCSYSQESLRFVRLDELKTFYPSVFSNIPEGAWPEGKTREEAQDWLKDKWISVITSLEKVQGELADFLQLDKLPFDLKKKLTSSMRRLAPEGLGTDIMLTANHRVWRHVITMRTSRHAEEEIRLGFNEVFEEQRRCYPNIYQDATVEVVDGINEVIFEHVKV